MDDFQDIENRKRLPAIPADLQNLLTELQYLAVRRIEDFGWDLKFVRRENLPAPIVVVSNHDGRQLGILEADGRLNLQHQLKIRA
jgi:hypothetical protein